jgi:hypothetical protein
LVNFVYGANPWLVFTNGLERMRIDSAGNVGIGTSSPGARLHVQGNEIIVDNGANGRLTFATNDSSANRILSTTQSFGAYRPLEYFATEHRFTNGTTERARIDSSGNLLVGKTSTDDSVQGTNINSNGSVEFTSANSGTQYPVTFYRAGSTSAVGFISTSTLNTTTYSTSSDYRLKEDVRPMQGALAKLQLLKPVTYKWKVDGSDGQGFIAHELQEVVPECVTGEKDAVDADGKPQYQGIDTSFLVATLTAALQEAVAEINSLKTRIEALEGTQP